jgi:hypothetical protein
MVITLGNAALDFSRFHMLRAAETVLQKAEPRVARYPHEASVHIGAAAMLRNLSILMAELGQQTRWPLLVEKLLTLMSRFPDTLAIQEEAARALSNAITTRLGMRPRAEKKIQADLKQLEALDDKYGTVSHKIRGAMTVARKNLKGVSS